VNIFFVVAEAILGSCVAILGETGCWFFFNLGCNVDGNLDSSLKQLLEPVVLEEL
jgi:hypothetical protein